MVDLISRKSLLEEIKNGKDKPKIYDGMQEVSWINECIQNAPIAFDLEILVEKIKDLLTPLYGDRHGFCSMVSAEECVKYGSCEICMTNQIAKIIKEEMGEENER